MPSTRDETPLVAMRCLQGTAPVTAAQGAGAARPPAAGAATAAQFEIPRMAIEAARKAELQLVIVALIRAQPSGTMVGLLGGRYDELMARCGIV